MSDYAADRNNEREDVQVLLSKRECGESSCHKHSPWMTHWKKASSSSDPQVGKSCGPFKGSDAKDCGTLPFEIMKTRVAKRLMVGMSHAISSAGNAHQFNSNVWNVACDFYHAVECKDGDQGDKFCKGSMMQKAVVSNKFSVQKLMNSSSNWETTSELLRSDNQSSEWSHFPMFEINRKIESILNRKRRSGVGVVSDNLFVPQESLKLNVSASSVMAFSSKEYQFHSQRITDETMKNHKSDEVILSPNEVHIGLRPDLSGQKLKGHLSNAKSCSCSDTEDISSSSQFLVGKQHTSPNFSNSGQKPPKWSARNKLSVTKSNNKVIESIFPNPKSSKYRGQKEPQDFVGAVYYEPVPRRAYESTSVNDFSKHGNEKFHGTCRSQGVACRSLPLHDEQHHLNKCTVDSAANLTGSHELPDATEKLLIVERKGEALTHGKRLMAKFTDSSSRSPCLFEMLTVPSKSNGACSTDSQSVGESRCNGVCMYGTNIGSHLLGKQNQSSAKTDTLHIDIPHASKFSAGLASTAAHKDSVSGDSAKSEPVSTSSIKGVSSCNKEDDLLLANAECPNSSSKATWTSKQDWSMSKTASMNLDQILFQMSRLKNPISNALIESTVCLEPSNRWLKRLRHDASCTHFPAYKRLKVGDGPSGGETSSLFGQGLSYDRASTDKMMDDVKVDQLSDERLRFRRNPEESGISAKSLNSWIGRWCQGGAPVLHGAPGQAPAATKSNLAPEELEGQFPTPAM